MHKLKTNELGRLSIDAFKETRKLPITIVLDNVRSMHNVGSIFRTSDAFAVERIFLCGITGKPPHREIEKTALGATQSVEWKGFTSTKEAVIELKKEGYFILSIEQTSTSNDLLHFIPQKTQKYALIFGNEVDGVCDEVLDLSDEFVEIPQFGTKHSFNIAISIGIVLWDFFSKWNK